MDTDGKPVDSDGRDIASAAPGSEMAKAILKARVLIVSGLWAPSDAAGPPGAEAVRGPKPRRLAKGRRRD